MNQSRVLTVVLAIVVSVLGMDIQTLSVLIACFRESEEARCHV